MTGAFTDQANNRIRELRGCVYLAKKVIAVKTAECCGANGCNAGRSWSTVQQSHLTERLAGLHYIQRQLAPSLIQREDPSSTRLNDVQSVTWLAAMEKNLTVGKMYVLHRLAKRSPPFRQEDLTQRGLVYHTTNNTPACLVMQTGAAEDAICTR
jgi:hypothetical protein